MTTAGAQVQVVTGVTTNVEGMPVPALGIGESDTAVLDPLVAAAIIAAIEKTQDDAGTAASTWRRRPRP